LIENRDCHALDLVRHSVADHFGWRAMNKWNDMIARGEEIRGTKTVLTTNFKPYWFLEDSLNLVTGLIKWKEPKGTIQCYSNKNEIRIGDVLGENAEATIYKFCGREVTVYTGAAALEYQIAFFINENTSERHTCLYNFHAGTCCPWCN
jgi:hypothetical protein